MPLEQYVYTVTPLVCLIRHIVMYMTVLRATIVFIAYTVYIAGYDYSM